MTKRVLLVTKLMRQATLERLRPVAAAADAIIVSERRSGADRRSPGATDGVPLRRDRRVGERRAPVEEVSLRLPVRLLPHRGDLRLLERSPLPPETLADHEALRLLVRHAEGDPYAARILFETWFDRAYAYLSGWLENPRSAQVAAQTAFLSLLRGASTLDVQRTSFRVLLVEELHAASGLNATIEDVATPSGRIGMGADDGDLDRLARLSQLDLYVLLARLTSDERRVVMLRHVLKLDPGDAGRALKLSDAELAQVEGAALARLLLEVRRLGHAESRAGERIRMRAMPRFSPVVCSRRAALALRV